MSDLRPFSSAEYRKRTAVGQTGDECCLCGRAVGTARCVIRVPVNHELGRFATRAECEADVRGAISYFPIGPECYKRWRKTFDSEDWCANRDAGSPIATGNDTMGE